MNTNSIEKVSYKKGKYYVVIDECSYILNDIIYGRILPYVGKKLTLGQLNEIKAFNYQCLDKGIKKLINNTYCEFDFYLFLKKNEIVSDDIKIIMRILKNEDVINNRRYANYQKEVMENKKGIRAFKNFLILKKVDPIIIDSVLENYHENSTLAYKIAARYAKTNKYSKAMLIAKIKVALLNKGFSNDIINEVIDSLEYDETIALNKYLSKIDIKDRKEYEKLIRKGFHLQRRESYED